MEAVQRPIGFWLKLVDNLIDQQFAAILDEHGVTRRQWQLLNVLARGPAEIEALDAAVAPFLNTDDGESSVEHLDELLDSGWVFIEHNRYSITERGAGSFERLTAVVADVRATASAGLSDEEYATTVASLETIARNLGWDPPGSGSPA
jgi:DNA-binding MarR family transcriptional regulator